MDPIRFAVVNPMHCLFLSVAKWIIKSIFVKQNKLTMEQLRMAQKRMKHVDLPSDIGQISAKIAIGNDGFSNLTADQWKTFIMIYSTTALCSDLILFLKYHPNSIRILTINPDGNSDQRIHPLFRIHSDQFYPI